MKSYWASSLVRSSLCCWGTEWLQACFSKGSKAEGGGWIVITAGWAFAVMAASPRQPHAEATPRTLIRRSPWDSLWHPATGLDDAPTILAQLLGAFAGAFLVWVHYFPHWAQTKDEQYVLVSTVTRTLQTLCCAASLAAAPCAMRRRCCSARLSETCTPTRRSAARALENVWQSRANTLIDLGDDVFYARPPAPDDRPQAAQ